ncbi:MAG: hypothetical protein KAX54_00010 [Thauera sp.]|nr:hypothetical protein [Thauera sp.]
MTTAAFLISLSGKPPAARIAEIDGALWGQSVDPVWPEDDVRTLREERLKAERELRR